MRRFHPYSRNVRLFLLLTLLGSLSALFFEVAAESTYLLTRHANPDSAIAEPTLPGQRTALAF